MFIKHDKVITNLNGLMSLTVENDKLIFEYNSFGRGDNIFQDIVFPNNIFADSVYRFICLQIYKNKRLIDVDKFLIEYVESLTNPKPELKK
jgi:hypothetical protein